MEEKRKILMGNYTFYSGLILLLTLSLILTPLHVRGAPPSLQKELAHQALIAYNNGNYTKTIFLLKQALKLDPNNPKLLTNLASAEKELGNFTSAISFYKKALEKRIWY